MLKNFEQKSFLLAISGGADSMVLASLFEMCDLKFQIAHVNYHFRGEDSNLDQKVVENFCKKNDIKLHLRDVSDIEKLEMKSLQNWARKIRYQFFFEILKNENLDFIVTAHHLNDELETFIINLSRGSGIKGLSGIPASENQILRPLLHFTKEEIYRFTEENGVDFREDKSNEKNDYLRNRIRNEIVPKLSQINENFLFNFGQSLNYLNQTKNFVEEKINEILRKIISEKGENIVIDKLELTKQSDFVKYEVLRKFGFDDEKEIAKIFKAETGKYFKSNNFLLTVNRDELILTSSEGANRVSDLEFDKANEEIELNINSKNEVMIPENIQSQISSFKIFEWDFDADEVVFPLKLRKKKEGDAFFPVGMKGKKKVSKFFRDEKISTIDKQKIWILTDGKDNILGVVPFRQDKRFSSKKQTQKVLKIKI